MHTILIIALALFLGLVAAGLVWFAWSFAENVLAGLASAKARKTEQDSATQEGEAP